MNRIFKTIYNKKLGRIDVVSEVASNRGLSSSVNEQAGLGTTSNGVLLLALRPLTVVLWAAFGLIAMPSMAAGLPTNGQVVVGQGGIASNGNSMTVNQATERMAINWQSFDIGAKNSVTFIQPGSRSVALNRVIGGGSASQIMGSLNANGQVFLLNPNGILVGKDAVINTGGLLASTYSMSDANFAAGKYELRAGADSVGQVINQGHLRATGAGFVVLAANKVDNQGVISTPSGTTALVAGQQVTLKVDGNGTTVSVDGSVVDALVRNQGLITAQDGRVYLTARGQQQALNESVNNSGVIRANSLTSLGGQVTLDGGGAGIVTQAGSIDVSGGKGGKVVVTGQNVHLVNGSSIDATGQQGGGQVYVGGGWQGKDATIANAQAVVMDRGAIIDVSARQKGDGGTAVLWSNNITRFHGQILARGAQQGGKGGQVETSSHGNLQAFGSVDASAVNGKAGSWLLDPTDVTIVSSSTANNTNNGTAIWQPTGTGSQILNTSINDQLNAGTSVTILTNGSDVTGQWGNITVSADIAKTGGDAATSLTLKADGNIVISNQNITSTAGALDVNLCAGQSSAVTSIVVNNARITTNNGSLRMGRANASNNVSINITGSTIDVGSSRGSNITGQSATGTAVLVNNSVIGAGADGAPVVINGQSGSGIGVHVTGASNLTKTAITASSQKATGFKEDGAARIADSAIEATTNSGQTTTAVPAADIYGTIVNSTVNGTTNHTNTGLSMSAGVIVENGANIVNSTLTGRAKTWDAGLLLYNATLTNSTLVGYGGSSDGISANLSGMIVRGNFTGSNVTLQGISPNSRQGIWFTNTGTIRVTGSLNVSGSSATGTGVDLSSSAVTISADTMNICGTSSSGTGFNINFTRAGGIANPTNITLSSKGSPDAVRNVIGTRTFTQSELLNTVMPRGIENLTSINATGINFNDTKDFALDYTQPGKSGGWLLSGANVNVTGGNASFRGVGFENGNISVTGTLSFDGSNIYLNNEKVTVGNFTANGTTVTINSSNITANNAINITGAADYSTLSFYNKVVSLSNSRFKAVTLDVKATANSLKGAAAGGSGVTLNNDTFDLSGSGQITGVTNAGFTGMYDGTPGVVLSGTTTVLNGNLTITGDGGENTGGIRATTGVVLNVAAGASLNLNAKSNIAQTGKYGPYASAFTVVDVNADSPQALNVTGGGGVTLTAIGNGGAAGAMLAGLNVGKDTTVTINATANNGSGLALNNVGTQSGAVVNLIGTSQNGSGIQIGNLPSGGTGANTLTQASGASVSIQGNSTNGIGVNVANATLDGLTVSGATTGTGSGVAISGTLTKSNGATLNANGGANGTAITLNNATLSNTSLGGNSLNATAQNGTAIAVTGNTTVTNLTLNGSSINGAGVSVAGNLTQAGASATNGTSVNGGGVSVTGSVKGGDITGSSTDGSGVSVANSTLDGVNVTGSTTGRGSGVTISGTLNKTNGTSLTADGGTNGTAITLNNATLSNTSLGGNSLNATAQNGTAIAVTGNTTLANLTLNGSSINGTGVSVAGNLTQTGTGATNGASVNGSGVSVSGNVTGGSITGNSSNGTGMNVSGANVSGANVTGNSSAGAGVNVSGNTTLNGANVIGNSTLANGVNIGGNLSNTNGTTIQGTGSTSGVNVSGNVTGGSVTGNSTNGPGVNVSGSNVTGTTITGNSSAGAGVNVSGNTTLNGANVIGNSPLADGVNISGNLGNTNGTTIHGTGSTSGVNVSGNVTGGSVTGNSTSGTGVNVTTSNMTGVDVTGNSGAGAGVNISGNVTGGSVTGNSGSGTGVNVGGNMAGGSVTGNSGSGIGVNISGNTTVTNTSTEGNSGSGTGVQVNPGATVIGGSVTGISPNGVGVSNDGAIINAMIASRSGAGGAIPGGGRTTGSTVRQTTLAGKPGVVTGGPDSVLGRSTYLTIGKTFMSSFPRRKTTEDVRSTAKNLTICERGSKNKNCQ